MSSRYSVGSARKLLYVSQVMAYATARPSTSAMYTWMRCGTGPNASRSSRPRASGVGRSSFS
jgi:hypothetical protein